MAKLFNTPQNERSFSGLIDSVLLETGRPDSILTAIQYANATIRECQALGLFARDRLESTVVVDTVPFIYERPPYFRSIATVKYGSGCYPKLKLPGRGLDMCEFFYAADDYYVFQGTSAGTTISFLNYYWAKPMMYFGLLGTNTALVKGGPYAIRPAYFDIFIDMWMYLNDAGDAYVSTTGNVDTDKLRQKLSLTWLVQDWFDLIANGTKAKIFAQFSDNDRATRTFAAYKQMQNLMKITCMLEAEASAQ